MTMTSAAAAAQLPTESTGEAPRSKVELWGAALGGPAMIGLCLGIQGELSGMFLLPICLPLLSMLIAALTLPGLYVGASMLESAPAAAVLLRRTWEAMSDGGVALLGLSPALLVLTSASSSTDESVVLTTCALGLGLGLALRSFWRRMLGQGAHMARLVVLLSVWSLIVTGISWQMYWHVLHIAGGL